MGLTKQRTIQYIGILIALFLIAVGYWYFSARAGVKQGAPLGGPAPSNLVGYWSFDGDDISGTTAYDRSGSGNNGTLTNGPVVTTGKLGQALSFDGTDDHVAVPDNNSLDITGALTISAWIKPTSVTPIGDKSILRKEGGGDNYGFVLGGNGDVPSGNLEFVYFSGSWRIIDSGYKVPNTDWHHVVVTFNYSNTSILFYDNGVLVATKTAAADLTPNTSALNIGMDMSNKYFSGFIDELRIYNTALTASQVYDLYKLGGETVGASTPTRDSLNEGLAGYWKLDDASGTTAVDSSTNANNGTLTNGPTWGTGQIDGAVTFDSTDDYINVGTAPNVANQSFTFSIWAKRTTTGVNDYFFGQGSQSAGNGFHFGFNSNNKVRCSFYNAAYDLDTTGTYTDSNWHLWMCTYDDVTNMKKIYQDGVLLASGTTPSDYAGSGSLKIGSYIDGTSSFGGQLDEARMYNRLLSSDEITRLYKTTTPSNPDMRLKGYWSFDGDSISGTTARDLSGAGNNGTLTNGPTTDPGIRGQAMSFDGTDDYVSVPSSSSIHPALPFTLSYWVKSTSLASNQGFVGSRESSSHEGYWMSAATDGSLTLNYGAYTGCSSIDRRSKVTAVGAIVVNQWQHIVGVIRGATDMDIYINGVDAGGSYSGTGGGISYMTSPILRLGSRGGSGGCPAEYLNGQLDEVRIYNAALTASEIYNLYQEGGVKVNKSQSNNGDSLNDGLAGYWKLDDGSGVTATDSSGNANSGTLTNGPTWTTGQIGSAVNFDGVNDTITTTNGALTDKGSISAWVQATSNSSPTTSYQFFTAGGSGTFITIDYNTFTDHYAWTMTYRGSFGTQLEVKGKNNGADDTYLHQWHHIVATWDVNKNSKMYVDGVLEGTYTGTTGTVTNANSITLGATWAGKIDEMRRYTRELSADEVARLYKTTSPTNPETGLVGYWSFNGKDMAGTTAYDRSGKGNNGTLTNGPTTDPGKIGQALTFDGTDDYVSVANESNFDFERTNSFSSCAWFNITTTVPVAQAIVTKLAGDVTGGWDFGIVGDKLEAYVQNTWPTNTIGVKTTAAVSTNTWNHGCFTYDGSSTAAGVTLYLNGSVQTKTTDYDNLSSSILNNNNVGIGERTTGGGSKWPLSGKIDEVRIYNRVLSSTEISSLYNYGR